MTRLQQALTLRGVEFERLAEYLRPKPEDEAAEGLPRIGVRPVTRARLSAIHRGAEPTEHEAEAIGAALDWPAAFFAREQERPTIDDSQVFVCSRGPKRRPRCACGEVATLLCDAPKPPNDLATCDRPICRRCAVEVGRKLHRCPEHAPSAAQPVPLEDPVPKHETVTVTVKKLTDQAALLVNHDDADSEAWVPLSAIDNADDLEEGETADADIATWKLRDLGWA